MKPSDVILIALPQADGKFKNRPALLLKQLPRFGDWLVCGISTQLHQTVPGFDEVLARNDPDYAATGVMTESVIRLGFLAVIPHKEILGTIGQLSTERHRRLLKRLSDFLLT